MNIIVLVLIWLFNFGVSWLNAWVCGKAWEEAKLQGGWAQFMLWMGATMSACGFSWCYLILLVIGGSYIPVGHNTAHTAIYAVSPDILVAAMNLGFLILIGPIIGSGLAITVNSWAVAYRERTLGSGAIAGWNTFAQAYNMYQVATLLPQVLSELGGFFSGKSASTAAGGDAKAKAILIVIALVVVSIVGGILTTRAIIVATARDHVGEVMAGMPRGVRQRLHQPRRLAIARR